MYPAKLIGFIIFLGFTGCTPVYFPSVDSTPMFTGKGEVQVQGGISIGGITGQAAYAVSDHFALATTFVKINDASYDYLLKYETLEASAGYYGSVDDRWRVALWGGLGVGKNYTDEGSCFFCNSPNYIVSSKFKNAFVQATFWQGEDNFQWGITSKVNFLYFDKLRVLDGDTPIAIGPQSHAAFESAFFMRLFIMRERFFWTYQIGLSAPISAPDFDWVPFKVSTGIGFRFGHK